MTETMSSGIQAPVVIDTSAVCSALLVTLSGLPGRVQQALEQDGFWVTTSQNPAEALWRLQTLRPDLLILQLDGRHPEEWQQCQRLGEVGGQPLLVVVDDPAVESRLAALASGADDVLASTFHPLELAARARALLRRGAVKEPSAPVLRHRELELDLEGHLAALGGRPLALSPLEFRLLRTLLENPRRTFSRDELLARIHVFDERYSSERSIDLHITELRRKLGDAPHAPLYLETVRGVGYRLALPNSESQNGQEREVPGWRLMIGDRDVSEDAARLLQGAEAAVVVAATSRREAEAVASHLRRRGLRAEALPSQYE